MANGHGGARPGAGRPRTAQRYQSEVAATHDAIAERLPQLLDNLFVLADGGYEQITEVAEPAGMIYVTKQVETKDGTIRVSELAFPELPPEQLVVVRRTRSYAAPDRKANEYLINRVAGVPTQHLEIEGDGVVEHVHMSLDEWKQQAAERLAAAEATLAAGDDATADSNA